MEESQVKCEVAGQTNVGVSYHAVSEEWGEMADRTINMLEKIIENAICKMAASTMYRKSPGALAAGGRCLIGCILSRLSGDKKAMRRSRSRKEAEKTNNKCFQRGGSKKRPPFYFRMNSHRAKCTRYL